MFRVQSRNSTPVILLNCAHLNMKYLHYLRVLSCKLTTMADSETLRLKYKSVK